MTHLLKTTVSTEQQARLRKLHVCPLGLRTLVYSCAVPAHCPAITAQFGEDCRVYNVWEALLYVENYAKSGHYFDVVLDKIADHLRSGKFVHGL